LEGEVCVELRKKCVAEAANVKTHDFHIYSHSACVYFYNKSVMILQSANLVK